MMGITNLVRSFSHPIENLHIILTFDFPTRSKRLENVFHFQVTMLDGWPQLLVVGGAETSDIA